MFNCTHNSIKKKKLKHARAEAAIDHCTEASIQCWSLTTKVASHVEYGEKTKRHRKKRQEMSMPCQPGGTWAQGEWLSLQVPSEGDKKLCWFTAPTCKPGMNTDSAFNHRMTGARSFLPMNLSFIGLLWELTWGILWRLSTHSLRLWNLCCFRYLWQEA